MTQTKRWSGVDEAARDTLTEVGEYVPTWDGRFIKGVKVYLGADGDGRRTVSYLDATECRRMAAALNAAADWLDIPGETADEVSP